MPCNTDQGQDEWFEKQYGTNNPDKLRGMLCSVLKEIQYQDPGIVLDKEVWEWFEKHKKWDLRRIELGLKNPENKE